MNNAKQFAANRLQMEHVINTHRYHVCDVLAPLGDERLCEYLEALWEGGDLTEFADVDDTPHDTRRCVELLASVTVAAEIMRRLECEALE